jgi:hypothetical protein
LMSGCFKLIYFWAMRDSHQGEADPLDSKLRNAKETSGALERLEFLATADGISRTLDGHNVCESRSGRGGAEEDKVGRNAF